MNALAVLHPRRFLAQYGLSDVGGGGGGALSGAAEQGPLRTQVARMLTAARYMRWPLIFINCLVVLIELLFG